MIEYIIKILGVQFAANPDYRFGDPETPEMWAKTIALLTELRDTMPRVVLKAEPTNSHDNRAVMVRARRLVMSAGRSATRYAVW